MPQPACHVLDRIYQRYDSLNQIPYKSIIFKAITAVPHYPADKFARAIVEQVRPRISNSINLVLTTTVRMPDTPMLIDFFISQLSLLDGQILPSLSRTSKRSQPNTSPNTLDFPSQGIHTSAGLVARCASSILSRRRRRKTKPSRNDLIRTSETVLGLASSSTIRSDESLENSTDSECPSEAVDNIEDNGIVRWNVGQHKERDEPFRTTA